MTPNPLNPVGIHKDWQRDETVPVRFRKSLANYLAFGRPVGGFLAAVIDNNLRESAVKADDAVILADIKAIALWLYYRAPTRAYGHPDARKAWMNHEGQSGLWVQTTHD